MSKIRIRWATRVEASYQKTFDPDELPETIKRAIVERFEDEDIPFEVDLDELDLDDVDELAEHEEDATETDYSVSDRFVEGVRAIAPTPQELGIPGVVHISEALDTVDAALEQGDDHRDAERGK